MTCNLRHPMGLRHPVADVSLMTHFQLRPTPPWVMPHHKKRIYIWQETCQDIKRVVFMTIAIVMLNCGWRLLEWCHITRNICIWQETYKDIKRDLHVQPRSWHCQLLPRPCQVVPRRKKRTHTKRDLQKDGKTPGAATVASVLALSSAAKRLIEPCYIKRDVYTWGKPYIYLGKIL